MARNTFGPEVTEKAFKENTKHIVSDPFNAIIELISNSWDAGAEKIIITWPDERGEEVILEDNGEGMTETEFREIYPKMSYSRLKVKGKEVYFRRKREGYREAYGKHGKGRFAPFCFADSFIVETWKNGQSSKFKIKRDKESGFIIELVETVPKEDSGTKIYFKLNENYRDSEKIKKEIGARFLTDPLFSITINGKKIEFDDLEDNLDEIPCKIDNETVKILKIKSNQKSRNTHFHGVTWILGKRRIKTTKWNKILDGRIEEAKQYAYVIHSDILKDELNETMSDFSKSDNSIRIQNKIMGCIKKSVSKIMAEERNNIKKKIITDNLSHIKAMGSIDQDEVGQFISELQEVRTAINPTDLKAATEVFIKIKQSKNGEKLFHQLNKLTIKDFDILSEILEKWTIKEARVVLGLIRSRLDLIEELELKCDNPTTLELQELQPLFEDGLWIFGPEYESIEFTSNKSLTTVVISLLKKKGIKIKESRLRPDFVVLPDSAISFHSCNEIDKILFIELKRGGFKVDLDERTQVEKYINILVNEGAISESTMIEAYVLGSTVVCEEVEVGKRKNIKIIPMQYHKILDKAEKRLLNLRKKIEEEKNIKDEPTDPAIKETLAQKTIVDYYK
ncbi:MULTISPECIES: ATP-binding protein [Methanobacterium]|uniref:ATP-binding protein n=1 Tax=Methanobacterium bryantii TaxID=2161 RepID=A0A2A2H980_METBR|nr:MULTISPECIES: ATP-binding protein [Methanobacterium]OEC85689.1 hypothetical protein A9507_13105 [Methanobacterium sp. A39]PAV05876.1 hypothetical protein ASJ80_13515 [Methanobacterium bryantii]